MALLLWVQGAGNAIGSDLGYWKNLLHYHGSRSLVTSHEFFLHERGDRDPGAELERTISLLNSEKGRDVACSFPARYLWIQGQGLVGGDFDLDSCSGLSDFVDNFQKDTISIVFASEHIDSPSSAFGHILLVFRDRDKPLLIADTIHFSAETPEDDPFLKYAFRGLFGGYEGYFHRTSFYIIQQTYTVIEQRSLNFFQLDLPRDKIIKLIYHFYELRKARYNYYFVRENCAFQIARLLEIAYEEHSGDYLDSVYVLPIEVVKHHRPRVVKEFALEPSLFKAQRLQHLMTDEEKRRLKSAKRDAWSGDYSSLPGRVKEYLYIENEYLFRRHRIVGRDYNRIMRLNFNNELAPFDVIDPEKVDNRHLIGLGGQKTETERLATLRYRFAGKDIYDNQLEWLNESTLSFFDLMLTEGEDLDVYVHRLDLLKARSMLSRSRILPTPSWSFYLGLNRENSGGDLAGEFAFGLGAGFGGRKLGADLILEVGIQGPKGDGPFYAKPRGEIIYYPLRQVKVGAAAMKKFGPSGSYTEGELFMSYYFGRAFLLTQFINTSIDKKDYLAMTINIPL
jgi:hypothetical protein